MTSFHTCCCIWQDFIFSHCWIIFYGKYLHTLYFLYLCIYWWALGLFPYVSHCEYAAMNLRVQMFRILFSFSLDVYLKVEFGGNSYPFTFKPTGHKGFLSSTSSPACFSSGLLTLANVRLYLIVAFTCFFWQLVILKCFHVSVAIVCLLWKHIYSVPLPISN